LFYTKNFCTFENDLFGLDFINTRTGDINDSFSKLMSFVGKVPKYLDYRTIHA